MLEWYAAYEDYHDAADRLERLVASVAHAVGYAGEIDFSPPWRRVTLRDAILDYVEGMEEAGTDLALIFAMVHEIRGFAQNAGMAATGRIAEILCRYLDEMDRAKKVVDRTIVTLHVAAIGRAARADRDDVKMGHIVADELSALVTRRLAEAGIIR